MTLPSKHKSPNSNHVGLRSNKPALDYRGSQQYWIATNVRGRMIADENMVRDISLPRITQLTVAYSYYDKNNIEKGRHISIINR